MKQRNCTKIREAQLLALVVIWLSGCASMSQEECLTADWTTVGYVDGTKGKQGSHIDRHREACAKHGVTPDLAQYLAGRENGLTVYCEPVNGFRVGKRGTEYLGVCPPESESGFLAGYNDGRELYQLNRSLSDIRSEINRAENRLDEIEEKLASNKSVVANGTDKDERSKAAVEIERLAHEKSELLGFLDHLALDAEHLDFEISAYERQMTDLYGSN